LAAFGQAGGKLMADQADVETALVSLLAGVLYPNGTQAVSAVGVPCRVYRGSPNSASLDADPANGVVNVTVFPEAGLHRVTTRYPAEWVVAAALSPTLSVSVDGETARISGTAGAGQLVGLLADQASVVHRTRAGDTPESVAASLVALLRVYRPALVTGATVIVPGVVRLVGRVTTDQTARRETRRQVQRFRITLWCPDPATRDAVAAPLDAALSGQAFIALADGTSARLCFVSSTVTDRAQDLSLYRRDLLYAVEYATTQTAELPCMVFGDIAVRTGNAELSVIG
jgi:hypothetical protein